MAISRISLFPGIRFVHVGKVAAPSDAPAQTPACRNPRWCGCRAPLRKRRSGLGPRTAPECSLTFLLTKPRYMGIVYRQVCVRGRKGAAHAEPAAVRPPLPQGDSIPTKCHDRGRANQKKMLIYIEQSRNVYENKRNMDKITAKKSDIYGNVTRILQKSSGFGGQFSLIDAFRAGFGGYSRRKFLPVARRAQRIFRQHGEASQLNAT